MELTDIHNRRANLELVARESKAHLYPFLLWPEDAQLLRLDDLPQLASPDHANKRVTWKTLEYRFFTTQASDAGLRGLVDVLAHNGETYALARLSGLGQVAGIAVAVFKVVTQ